MELVGDVRDQAILDLGCGNVDFGLESLKVSCRRYVGIEGFKNLEQSGKSLFLRLRTRIIQKVHLRLWYFDLHFTTSKMWRHAFETFIKYLLQQGDLFFL